MTIEAQASEFWENGFLLIENFFESELMDEYNALILDHFGLHPEYEHDPEFLSRSEAEVIPWFPQRDGESAFDLVNQNPELQEITNSILGPGWRALYNMVMFSKQGSKGQPWHQDCPPENHEHFNLNRLIYSMDITHAMGGQIVAVKGSHKKGEVPASAQDQNFKDELTLSPTKGSLLLLHGHVWHKVLPVTGQYRASINYRSVPLGTPEDVTDICVYRDMRYRFSTAEVVLDRLNS